MIATSNEVTILKHLLLRRRNRQILKTELPRCWSNWEAVSVRTSRSKRKSRICTHKPLNSAIDVFVRTRRLRRKIRIHMHKPLNAQNSYNWRKAVYVRTRHLNRKSRIRTHKPLNTKKLYNLRKAVYVRKSHLYHKGCTTYAKPLTFRKVVHKCAQKLYNIQKAAYNCAPRLLQTSRTNQQVDFKRHGTQQEVQVHTS